MNVNGGRRWHGCQPNCARIFVLCPHWWILAFSHSIQSINGSAARQKVSQEMRFFCARRAWDDYVVLNVMRFASGLWSGAVRNEMDIHSLLSGGNGQLVNWYVIRMGLVKSDRLPLCSNAKCMVSQCPAENPADNWTRRTCPPFRPNRRLACSANQSPCIARSRRAAQSTPFRRLSRSIPYPLCVCNEGKMVGKTLFTASPDGAMVNRCMLACTVILTDFGMHRCARSFATNCCKLMDLTSPRKSDGHVTRLCAGQCWPVAYEIIISVLLIKWDVLDHCWL